MKAITWFFIAVFVALVVYVIWNYKKLMAVIDLKMGTIKNIYGGNSWLTGSEPIGVKNNNPGNIRKSNLNWLGKVPLTENNTPFEKFYSIDFGVRAMIRNLQSYIKSGKNTIQQIVFTWAPPTENNSTLYVNQISQWSGLAVNEPIDASNKEQMQKLVLAMCRKEVGNYITADHFNAGWEIL